MENGKKLDQNRPRCVTDLDPTVGAVTGVPGRPSARAFLRLGSEPEPNTKGDRARIARAMAMASETERRATCTYDGG